MGREQSLFGRGRAHSFCPVCRYELDRLPSPPPLPYPLPSNMPLGPVFPQSHVPLAPSGFWGVGELGDREGVSIVLKRSC